MPQLPGICARACRAWSALFACVLSLASAPAVYGQQPTEAAGSEFDLSRAYILDSLVFAPFYVEEVRALRAALEEGVVHEETPLLVMNHEAGRLALLTEQLAYHHIAQGELSGEPWMVTF